MFWLKFRDVSDGWLPIWGFLVAPFLMLKMVWGRAVDAIERELSTWRR